MKLRLPTPLHPSATITLVVKTAIRRTSQGGGDAVPPRARPPPRNRTKPRRARLGSAGRARFREKNEIINSLVSIISAPAASKQKSSKSTSFAAT